MDRSLTVPGFPAHVAVALTFVVAGAAIVCTPFPMSGQELPASVASDLIGRALSDTIAVEAETPPAHAARIPLLVLLGVGLLGVSVFALKVKGGRGGVSDPGGTVTVSAEDGPDEAHGADIPPSRVAEVLRQVSHHQAQPMLRWKPLEGFQYPAAPDAVVTPAPDAPAVEGQDQRPAGPSSGLDILVGR